MDGMSEQTVNSPLRCWPEPAAVLELLKPVTWFAPMWAFLCGVISSGAPVLSSWPWILAGAILAGPLLVAASQAVNEWFDRHVDAINQPERPIPSGRVPGRWGLFIAILWSAMALAAAIPLGPWVFWAAAAGVALSWAYSAPPVRLKASGVWGPLSVGICYEGLAWFAGAAVMLRELPEPRILALAALYSLGAYGIMVLNDFKAVEGDRAFGLRSLPAHLGVERALAVACAAMILPQIAVVALLWVSGLGLAAAAVAGLVVLQAAAMVRLARDPVRFAPWYNMTGVLAFVSGMLVSAVAIGHTGVAA